MSSRYKVTGPWGSDQMIGSFLIQSADITDQHNGDRYTDGAFRVVRVSDGKPAIKGKGGTVPFFGESAWSAAERLAGDLDMAERYGR